MEGGGSIDGEQDRRLPLMITTAVPRRTPLGIWTLIWSGETHHSCWPLIETVAVVLATWRSL